MCGTAALLARFGGSVEINHAWLKQKKAMHFLSWNRIQVLNLGPPECQQRLCGKVFQPAQFKSV